LAHVVAGGVAHSFDMQQPVEGMHAEPQTLKLDLHSKSQVPLSHMASELGGAGQFVQLVPHFVGSSSSTQSFPHSWAPVSQAPSQAAPLSMHSPKQSSFPLGQRVPQDVPSQVASPPSGAAQAVQATPQLSMESSETQTPSHSCVLSGQLH